MLLWFLRLFPQFRVLESEGALTRQMIESNGVLLKERDELRASLQQETSRALLLQDRLDAAEQERQRLWDRFDTATKEMVTAYQMQVNSAWMKEFGTAPHVDAPAPPPKPAFEAPENPTVPRRMTPSEATAHLTRQFINSQISPKQPGD